MKPILIRHDSDCAESKEREIKTLITPTAEKEILIAIRDNKIQSRSEFVRLALYHFLYFLKKHKDMSKTGPKQARNRAEEEKIF